MKTRLIIAGALACACVAAAWVVQFRYGIGSCGPASDTPLLCLAFGMGPFYLLTDIPAFARAMDAVPNLVALGIMLVLPALIWFAVFFGVQTIGVGLWRRVLNPKRD